MVELTSQFRGWGLQQDTHGTQLPHSVCSPIYENALSPDSWEAPACWSILLSCEGLLCEKRRCVQIWPLVTAGWPVQHTELLTSSHIVHSAVVVETFPESIILYLPYSVEHYFTVCYLICLIFALKNHFKYYSSKIQLQVRGEISFISFIGSACRIPVVRCWWFDGRALTKTMCKQSVSLQLS